MKILNLADSHIKGINSQNRIGNYYQDCLDKFKEICKISQDCDIVIHSGDFYDTPLVSNIIVDDFLDLIELTKKHWFIVPGNHDEISNNWETSKASSLAHMINRSDFVHLLEEEEFDDFYLKGYKYYHGIEEDIKKDGLNCKKTDKYKIAVTHGFISIKPFHPQVLHVQAKDIKTNFDLVLCSHFHYYFDEIIKDTRFLNPGEIGRLSITRADHKPQVAIIDTETKEIELIKLKIAKPGSEVFDLSKAEELKAFDNNINNFISSLKSTKAQSLNIRGIITDICKENKVEKEVENLIIEKIGQNE